MVSSSSSPRRGREKDGAAEDTPPRMTGAGKGPGLLELLLDGREHRLAVRVALLVVAHLAQLRGVELAEALVDLGSGQVVVAEDRERRADAGHAARAVDLAQHALGGALDALAGDAVGAAQQALDVLAQAVGLLAPAGQQVRQQRRRVVARHAPAGDR